MEKKGTVIFGGSFDPVTKAHEDIYFNLLSRFNRVIVVPSKISPFKISDVAVDGNHRLNMLRAVFPNAEISTFELESEGVSYSCNTVKHYQASDEKLWFAIGSEEVGKIEKWENTEYLKKSVIFYIVERAGFSFSEEMARLNRCGYNCEQADFLGQAGSSSLFKLDLAFNKDINYVSSKVLDYIKSNGLYRDYFYIVERFNLFNLTYKRIEHTYRTAKIAIELAKRYGENVKKTITAALLHDIGKYTTVEELKEKHIPFSVDISNMSNAVAHAPIGAAIARYCFNIQDDDVLNAIESHTVAGINISKLQKIIFVADYIEEGRDFECVGSIRKVCFKDLDKGVEIVLESTIHYLKQNGKKIYHVTEEAWEFYKNHNKIKEQGNK